MVRLEMRERRGVFVFALGLGLSATAQAERLRVGPGETYETPCQAVAVARDGDTIEIAHGVYTDSCVIDKAELSLIGVSQERPVLDLSGTDHPAQYKGIFVVTHPNVTIENLELMGAHISPANGENAAAIRVEAPGLSVAHCYIHDNQNGILGGTTGTLTIEHSEFERNAVGDGCNTGGCTHNVYVANIDRLLFRFNWTHALATDTQDKGHLLKSRAEENYIHYNLFSAEAGYSSYELEFPNGGLVEAIGNIFQKGTASGNGTSLRWGAEGASNPSDQVLIAYNTFYSERDSGTFIDAAGADITVENNLFAGGGIPVSGSALPASNVVSGRGGFEDYSILNFRPVAGSLAIGAADPSLTGAPEYEYIEGASFSPRPNGDDVGALAFAVPSEASDAGIAPNMGSGGASGRPAPPAVDGGGVGSGGQTASGGVSGASGGTPGSGGAAQGSTDETVLGADQAGASDCACRLAGCASRRRPWLWPSVFAVLCIARYRRAGRLSR